MTKQHQYFHFTLGPVQGFVAQARRTRDFWAGSFILSWLSSVAMYAVKKQQGEILFPLPDEDFIAAIESGSKKIKQGNVPNRFKAKVGADFKPEKVELALQQTWCILAEVIWQGDFGEKYKDSETHKIWQRQVESFWDIQWALVEQDDKSTANILDRTKNWRTHLPPQEGGVKCMIMDGWQELSGAVRPGRKAGDSGGPDAFWKTLRESKRSGIATDLRPGEKLCAIAYIKRRFSRYFDQLKATVDDNWSVKGWQIPSAVPSVDYIAAAPWLAQLINKAKSNNELYNQLWAFHDAAHELTGAYNSWDNYIRCVRDAIASSEEKEGREKRWAALDGTVFFDFMLENRNLWGEEKAQQAKKVLSELKKIRRLADIEPVSPFYAILLMDGDNLGHQMSDVSKQSAISTGLAKFTKQVSDIVDQENGFLIYAGGDDVLAILPVENAFPCAALLRKHYQDCFADQADIQTSISAAIEFAHIKTPLGKVLKDAQTLLKDIAKDGRGRDAIACRVWKPGGLQLEWAMPWEKALLREENKQERQNKLVIDHLASEFRQANLQAADEESSTFANRFFYRIGERFDLLNPVKKSDGSWVRVFDDSDHDSAVSLMAMEYLNSGKSQSGPSTSKEQSLEKAREMVRPLLEQCQHWHSPATSDTTSVPEINTETGYLIDGALLVRFLAQKGIE